MPRLYETVGLALGRKVIHARFFTNVGSAEWLLAEFDGHDLAFGWVSLGLGPSCDEWGYFSLRELGELYVVKDGFPIYVERDLVFTPILFGKCGPEASTTPP